jgi:hypothetical protein
MTPTLELSLELERALNEVAASAGLGVEECIVETLRLKLSVSESPELERLYKELGEAQRTNPHLYPPDIFGRIDREDSAV